MRYRCRRRASELPGVFQSLAEEPNEIIRDPVATAKAFCVGQDMPGLGTIQDGMGNTEPRAESIEEATRALVGTWQSVMARIA